MNFFSLFFFLFLTKTSRLRTYVKVCGTMAELVLSLFFCCGQRSIFPLIITNNTYLVVDIYFGFISLFSPPPPPPHVWLKQSLWIILDNHTQCSFYDFLMWFWISLFFFGKLAAFLKRAHVLSVCVLHYSHPWEDSWLLYYQRESKRWENNITW